MILFTLDTKKRYKKSTRIFLAISLFSIIFSTIYEKFSYGEFSIYMRFMFIIPLIMGTFTYALIYLLKSNLLAQRVSYLLWHSSIAILMSGALIKGIISISGRHTNLEIYYFICGSLFALAAIFNYILHKKKTRNYF